MYRGTLTIVGTALAAGVLVGVPVAVASQGADDPAALVAADDSSARVPGLPGVPLKGGGNTTDVRVQGTCTGSSSAKLTLSPENGRVEVEFEVDENRRGSVWGVVLKRNGVRVLGRSATTRAPSGSFEVRAVIGAGSPRTRVVAVARRDATGEVCRASATL